MKPSLCATLCSRSSAALWLLAFLSLLLVVVVPASAQSPGAVDLSFKAGTLVNGPVCAMVVQPDGKVVIGGDFITVRGAARNRIARLNADGSVDTSFDPGMGANASVYCLAQQSDGKVLVGGDFTTINGTARNRIARLNADGTLDTSFNPGTGANGMVRALALRSDGKVMVGGAFTTIDGTTYNRIARLNADGSLDTTFSGTGTNSAIYSLALQGDGKVLVGGAFTIIDGITRNYIARLNADGDLDTSFNPSNGADGWVYALVLQTDGKVLAGGDFFNVNGAIRNHIARLNADGSLDMTFTGTGTNGSVRALAVQSDGRVSAVGNFTDVNNSVRNRIARLNADGSLDTLFNPGWGANVTVNTVALQSDGRMLIGGDFTTINDATRRYIARLNADGSPDTAFSPGWGVNSGVYSLALQSDGKVLVGSPGLGGFTAVDDAVRNYIARLNIEGSLDTSFNPGNGANSSVYCLAPQSDGKVLVGGNYTAISGTARNRIARLSVDGSLDTTFNPGTGANNWVICLAPQSDGKVLLGGLFTTINGTARNRIARLNADGTLDTSFNPGTGADNTIRSLILQSDGKVLVAGDFTTINGTARNRIARLNADGTLDTSFNPGTGADNTVYSLAVQSDGKVLVGGGFTTINGTARNRIVRLNANGTLDMSFDPGIGANNTVLSLALQSNGKVLVGGTFTTVDGTARNRIARLNANGTLDTSFDPGLGASSSISSVALQSDGKVLAGGDFTSFNGAAAAFFTRLDNDAATQSLGVTSAGRVEWLRGGSSPEVEQVRFELSSDGGTTWSVLGVGTRIPGGWECTGLNLPVVGLLRASARTTGGYCNGSSGLVQTMLFLPSAPSVTTSAATSITAGGAVLSGKVNPNGLATTAYFEYGLSSAYGNTAPVTLSPADGTAAQSVSVILSGLQPATTYYYRLVATNSLGTTTSNGSFTTARAQVLTPGAVDLSFDAGSSVNGSVNAIVPLGGGKVLIGGEFTAVRGALRNRIARLNADGTVDASFNPGLGADNTIFSLALQSDGKVLVGGMFTTINGTACSRIARLNADGTLDTSFNSATGADNAVRSFALQSDGKVLVGGDFTTINGIARNRIARLNADGTLDTSFNPGTGASAEVYSLALQSDGKVLMGGAFIAINGITRNRIARLTATGSVDTTFNPGTGANNWVFSVVLQSDARVLVGGAFTLMNGAGCNRIARLNADGTLDTSFNPGTGASGFVRFLALQSDGNVLLGGDFTTINGTTRNRIARMNAGGGLDTAFDPGTGANDTVFSLAQQSDGKVLLGGAFTTVNGTARNYVAWLSTNGSLDSSFDPGTGADNTVYSLAVQSDGKVLVGGGFTTINGTARNRIVRLNANGTLDMSFDPGTGANSTIYSLAVQSDGKVLVGGDFTTINGTTRSRIARLNADGTVDASFNPGTGANVLIYSVAVQSDGKVLVGGNFTTINGTARSRIARLNADGTVDTSFNPGTGANVLVYSVALQSDGKVLVGGNFTTINGTTRNRIARLNANGTLDTSFDPGTGANVLVYSVALQSDGKVLVGGNFTTINGTTRNRIARLNANGTLDTSFDPGTGANNSVNALALQSDGKVLIGGSFTTVSGTARSYIARLNSDGSHDTVFNPGLGASSSVSSVALQNDGKVLAGGDFTSFNDTAIANVVRVRNDAVTQSLGVTSAGRVEWLRGGSSPEVEQVRFELSSDGGTTWSVLGVGTRIPGGWECTGLNLPVVGLLRASARTTGGYCNGSSGLVQMMTSFFLPSVPSVTTSAATSITAGGAVLSGKVNPNGLATTAYFEYGLSSAYGNTAPVTLSPADGTAAQSVSVILSGLQPATTYYYRLVATNSLGTTTSNGSFTTARAQVLTPGAVDLSFDAGSSVNGSVNAIVPLGGGKVLIGGEFTAVRGALRNRIARLNADGTVDASFNPGLGADSWVESLALQSDGKVLVGGYFTTIDGLARSCIARLNADGSLDTSFDPGMGADSTVNSLALQSDGKVLVGGDFTTINGTTRNYIARLNANGSLDTTFNPGTGPNGWIQSLALQSDGKVLVGGAFTTINGTARNRIARLNANGSLDTIFSPGSGANDWVWSVAVQSDGKVLIGGMFTTINGAARDRIARLNANGSLDTTFTSTGADNTVFSLALQSDGKMLVGGSFTFFNATACNRIARLNADGSFDTTFIGTGANNTVTAVMLQSDGKVLVGGDFTTINGSTRRYFARLNADGSVDSLFDPGTGLNDRVSSLALQSDGKVLVGGNFTTINGTARSRIARLNANGSLDASFDPGTGANNTVYSLAVQSDGKVLVGGQFTAINGVVRNGVARLNRDGSLDPTFNIGAGSTVWVYSVAVQSDGKVLVGGDFTTINGTARRCIARLNTDGTLDTSFDPGTGASSSVRTLVAQSDGKVLLGGEFTSMNATVRNRIARLNANGTVDTSFNPGAGANSIVYSLALQSDAKMLLGGGFTTINGTARNRIARLNANGTLDTSFDPGAGANNSVNAVALQSNGKVLVAGNFTTINGTTRMYIARLNSDGNLDASFDPGLGASRTIYSLALQSDGKVLAGGDFTSFNGAAAAFFTRLDNDAATQSLGVTSAGRVEWLRGGSSPEVEQVRFELSSDGGTTWSVLGVGTRIPGGWECTGLNLPVVGLLRASARTTGGYCNGSSGLVQMMTSFFLPSVPSVTTSAATSITAGGAVLSGKVNPNGLATTAYFEYGLSSAYGNTAPVTLSPADGTAAQSVSVILSGLQPATTYYYRLVATNSLGTTTSNGSFTTTLMTRAEWRQRYFNTSLNSGNAADTADPDGDGQVNLLEFAFGTDPTLGQAGVVSFEGSGNGSVIIPGRETVSVSTTSGTVNYRARFVRRKNYITEGLTYTVQFSAALSSWGNSTATPAVVADDGILQVVEVPYPFFINGRKAQFFRVSVTANQE